MMFQQIYSFEKLSEFVGREPILQDVRDWMQDGNFHLVFFNGEYGIGKTRLLKRILDLWLRELKYDSAPSHLIDLYHFRHHSPEGLARAIFKCFEKTDNVHYFYPFMTAQSGLDRARAAGDSKAIREQLQKLLDNCVDGLKKMSSEHGVLLLFDTVEQFVYPTGERFAPSWDWLKSWIRDLPRGLVLFAGRPQADILCRQVATLTVALDFFTPKESRDYLLATAKRLSQEKGLSISFDEDGMQRLHNLSQGRPILLALFLELRIRDQRAFVDLSELQTETFEQKIINYLLSQPELGETLKAAGRAPKGINAALLARIRGITLREATQALETLASKSFSKTFPDDDRVFLHDDMYDLLEKYVYSGETGTREPQDAAQALYDYYKQTIKQKDAELKDIFASLAQEANFKQSTDLPEDYIPKIHTLEATRQELKTEFIYYRLRHQVGKKGKREVYEDDPILAGLKMYYRFGHEAATSNNDEVLIPLQIELTNFWLILRDTNLWKLFSWLHPEDRNFWKTFTEGLLLIHEVWLKVATGQPYLDDITILEENLSAIPDITSDQKMILLALLETWLGTGILFSRGAKKEEFERSNQTLTRAINSIYDVAVDQRLGWFKDVIISLAYRQRAYSYRIRGALKNAIEDFKEGLRFSRSIGFFHEEATSRNDFGFAQMLAGIFQSAFENQWDGLQLRYRVAIGHRIALSYSSLAQYFIATGAYEEARKHALYAIKIASAVGFRRGLGFGNLALAESTRRFAFSAQGPSNQAEYLQEAQRSIDDAIYLLDQIGEGARIIDAKLELACLYRDQIRLEVDSSKKKILFEKSNKQFLEVAKAAEEAGIEYRLVDAMCNRIWLGNYANELDETEQAAREFEILPVLSPYWLNNGKFANEEQTQKNPQLWSQIGKYYVGRGVMALKKWEKESKDEFLKDAARYMMLGSTYSTTFAEDHRGWREGRRTIYQILSPKNPDELKKFSRYVLDAEEAENILKKPSALQVLMKDHALWFAE
jgi:hypothetical protein